LVDPGVLYRKSKITDNVDANSQDEDEFVIPILADLLIMYSTSEGHYSFRNPAAGSWFIQSLIAELKENSHEELMTILTGVNRSVAFSHQSNTTKPKLDACKQMPNIVSMLTKAFYFNPKVSKSVSMALWTPKKITSSSHVDASVSKSSNKTIHVIKKNGEWFTPFEYQKVCQAFIEHQEKTADPYPIFHRNPGLVRGDIVFNCADKATVEWVKKTAHLISSSWDFGGLILKSEAELYSLKKATISFPCSVENSFQPSKAKECLSRANRGLNVGDWLIRSQKDLDDASNRKRKIITFMIDESSVKYVEDRGKQLHYQLGVVKVKLYGVTVDESIDSDN
jgi:hypothetical protein